MLRVVALLAACGSTPPTTRPAVDLPRVRAVVRGTWSTSTGGDQVTRTDIFTFDERQVTRTQKIEQVGGATDTRQRGRVAYDISEHGALAFEPSTGESLGFTAIVATGDTCAALHDRPCRVLGWDGLIAESPTVYRREHARSWQDERGPRHSSFVTLVRFSRPPAELTPDRCTIALEITAVGTSTRIVRKFNFACTVTPAARGRLARIAIAGFATQRDGLTSAWSNYAEVSRLADSRDRDAYDAFRTAFQPVMYFDPADPWVLYYDRPSGFHADP